MAGHSQFSNIKHRKEAQDSKRAGVFTQMSKLITVAVREGGGETDPSINSNLKAAINRANKVNMPKDRIKSAIEKGDPKKQTRGKETYYELYGPEGVAIVIKANTDNKNRTNTHVKMALAKVGFALGNEGSAMYLFKQGFSKPSFTINLQGESLQKYNDLLNSINSVDDVESIYSNLESA